MELLYEKLTALGFAVERPGGTFYIFPKALEEDANAFCLKAREFDLLLVPSDSFGVKGYVRLAYCIDTEKVKRSLPAFEKLAAATASNLNARRHGAALKYTTKRGKGTLLWKRSR